MQLVRLILRCSPCRRRFASASTFASASARHPGESGVQLLPLPLLLLVISAKAGIHLDLDLDLDADAALISASTPSQLATLSPGFVGLSGRRVTSLDSGHPALRPFGAAFGVRAAPAALGLCKEK
jgi:hypothetical protein